MRTCFLSAAVLAIAFTTPAVVHGQTIRQADLVGTWVASYDTEKIPDSLAGQHMQQYLTLDSTGKSSTAQTLGSQKGPWAIGWGWNEPWSVEGDSIRFMYNEELPPNSTASKLTPAYTSYKIELKGQQLIIWPLPGTSQKIDFSGGGRRWSWAPTAKECGLVFTRLDSSKPPPATGDTKICK